MTMRSSVSVKPPRRRVAWRPVIGSLVLLAAPRPASAKDATPARNGQGSGGTPQAFAGHGLDVAAVRRPFTVPDRGDVRVKADCLAGILARGRRPRRSLTVTASRRSPTGFPCIGGPGLWPRSPQSGIVPRPRVGRKRRMPRYGARSWTVSAMRRTWSIGVSGVTGDLGPDRLGRAGLQKAHGVEVADQRHAAVHGSGHGLNVDDKALLAFLQGEGVGAGPHQQVEPVGRVAAIVL